MNKRPAEPNGRKNGSHLYWFGLFLLALGVGLAGAFIFCEFKGLGTGQTYFGFICLGMATSVTGFILLLRIPSGGE